MVIPDPPSLMTFPNSSSKTAVPNKSVLQTVQSFLDKLSLQNTQAEFTIASPAL